MIRNARAADIPLMVELIRSTISYDFCYSTIQKTRLLEYASAERIERLLSAGQFMVYVDCGDAPLGFAGVTETNRRPLFVKPAEQGRGIGSLLLRHMERYTAENSRFPETSTTVRIYSTESATPFYENHGYRELQRIQYMMEGVGIPRIEMVKTIPSFYQSELNHIGGLRDDNFTNV